MPPRLHKFPYEPPEAENAHETKRTLPSIIDALPPGSYIPSPNGHVFHDLHDSQILLHCGVRVLHTPGHTKDSICLHIPQDHALYTADSVLGQGTAVFEDLSEYLASLQKMLDFNNGDPETAYLPVYPGHGPVVPKGKDLIKTYIQHRLEREEQIVKVLKMSPPPNEEDPDTPAKYWTTWTIVTVMYASYPESLWPAAAHSVELHLRKLENDGVVRRVGGEAPHTIWELVDNILASAPVDKLSAL